MIEPEAGDVILVNGEHLLLVVQNNSDDYKLQGLTSTRSVFAFDCDFSKFDWWHVAKVRIEEESVRVLGKFDTLYQTIVDVASKVDTNGT